MKERRIDFLNRFDWIRTGLMFEPRGHDMMSGSFLFPPDDPENDAGVLFIETSGCLPMCGHGTIGLVTFAIEQGVLHPKTEGQLRLETPAGLISVSYEEKGGKVHSVKLTNVPSFLFSKGLKVECPDLGSLVVDVAYGGNFYAIVEAQENYGDLADLTVNQILELSPVLRERLNESYTFEHPEDSKIQGLSHLMWTGVPKNPDSDARNAVFYGEKAIDRSPCGTGTSARMAHLFSQGKLKIGDSFVHESYIGSTFVGRVERSTVLGEYDGIIPSITGWAKITGESTITLDPEDPFVKGFTVK
jgi:4-hydroxyproline epimerase